MLKVIRRQTKKYDIWPFVLAEENAGFACEPASKGQLKRIPPSTVYIQKQLVPVHSGILMHFVNFQTWDKITMLQNSE